MDYKKISTAAELMATVLETHDKRYLFVKMFIPHLLGRVNLETNPISACRNIVDEIVKGAGGLDSMIEGMSMLLKQADLGPFLDLRS